MKTICIIIISLLIISIVNGQNIPYLSIKKGSKGLMIGVEVFNQKTKEVINPKDYIYEWTIPSLGIFNQTTNSNIIFVPPQSFLGSISNLILSLNIRNLKTKEAYFFKDIKLPLAKPRVVIILKRNNQLLPLVSKLKPTDILTFNVYNFPETNITYYWSFNGEFISNDKEISVGNLPEKSGIIKLRVFSSINNERVEDAKVIQIE